MGVWLFLKTLWLQYGEHSEEISAHWEIGWKNGVLEENCAVEADEVREEFLLGPVPFLYRLKC